MDRTEYPAISKRGRILVALLVGLLVFVLLFNWSGGLDSDPPICLGVFWTVPCGGWPAVLAGPVTAGLVWLLLGWSDRRDR